MNPLEGTDGAEGFAQLDLLNEAQKHEQQRDRSEQIRAGKALERADHRDQRAEQRDDQQADGGKPTYCMLRT